MATVAIDNTKIITFIDIRDVDFMCFLMTYYMPMFRKMTKSFPSPTPGHTPPPTARGSKSTLPDPEIKNQYDCAESMACFFVHVIVDILNETQMEPLIHIIH